MNKALVVGLGFAASVAVLASSSAVQASVIYAVEDFENQLLAIDPVTGVATVIKDLDDGPGTFLDTGVDSGADDDNEPNALAFDGEDTFYYTNFGNNQEDLFSYNRALDTFATITNPGNQLDGPIASAVYAVDPGDSDPYYYWWENDGGLNRINLANGVIDNDIIGTSRSTFGDLEIRDNRLFVSHANRFAIYDDIFGTPTLKLDIGQERMQLGFAGATLYGVDTGTGQIFTINQNTGLRAATGTLATLNGDVLKLNDAAGIAVPEPATLGLLGIGLAGLGFALRRRKAAEESGGQTAFAAA